MNHVNGSRPRDFFDVDMEAPENELFCGGLVMAFTGRCPGEEGANQDSAALIPYGMSSGLLVVADGVGGTRSGAEASRTAIEEISRNLEAARENNKSLREAVMTGFECANRRVRDIGTGCGTTLVVAEINAGALRSYHVGDSMIMVVGQRGKVRFQNVPHSPVGYAVEAGLIDEDQAMHHDDRHLISNALGSEMSRIDVGSAIRLNPRDTVLLASDGITDNIAPAEIVEIIRKGPLKKAAARLVELSKQRMETPSPEQPSKPDDHTFLLFRPGSASSSESEAS